MIIKAILLGGLFWDVFERLMISEAIFGDEVFYATFEVLSDVKSPTDKKKASKSNLSL